MITDINSLVSGQGKTSTTLTSSTANLGALAKLSSELKLIDGLHPIQITSVKNAQTSNGNQQLIGVTRNDQQQYTLVNDKPSPNLQAGDKGTLNVSGNQVTLTVASPRPAQTTSTSAQPSQPAPTSSANNPTQPSSSTTPTSSSISQSNSLTNVTQSPSTSHSTAPISSQPAQTIAKVAIASRPIVLTVIGSHQANTKAPTTTSAAAQNPAPPVASSQVSSASASKAHPNQSPSSPSNVEMSSGKSSPLISGNNLDTKQPSSTHLAISSTPRSASPQVASTTTFSALVTDGKEQFTLNTQHPLKAGETLKVMVDQQGQVQLYPAERSSPTVTTLTEGLKQTLPKQISPQEFVSMIRQLNNLAQSATALPEKVATALEQLVRQLPSLQNLTQSSDALKQAIQNSGLFSESNLAQKTNLASDFKLNLSRLEGANLETSKQAGVTGVQAANSQQAMSLVAGAIERITTNQVRHLIENAQQDGSILPLTIEIPIKDGQSTSVVNLKIDKDAADKDQDIEPHKRRWLVQLKFDFEETGRFEARASVQDKKVGILFAVEDANTEQMIRQRLDELRTSLRTKQVEIETLDCFRAKLDDKPNQYQEPSQRRLIDVRT